MLLLSDELKEPIVMWVLYRIFFRSPPRKQYNELLFNMFCIERVLPDVLSDIPAVSGPVASREVFATDPQIF